jgi:hypothetical protein
MMSWVDEQGIKITPGGDTGCRPGGSNRYAANSAGIAVLAARFRKRLKFSTSTPHHSCTTCGAIASFVVGFGRTASAATTATQHVRCKSRLRGLVCRSLDQQAFEPQRITQHWWEEGLQAERQVLR